MPMSTSGHSPCRSPEQIYLRELARLFGEAHGFRVTIGQEVEGRTLDLILEGRGGRHAFEISVHMVIEHEIANIQAYLASGFDTVAVIVLRRQPMHRLERWLAKAFTPDEHARVKVLAPEELPEFIRCLVSPTSTLGGCTAQGPPPKTDPAAEAWRRKAITDIISRSLKQWEDWRARKK